MLLSSPDKDRPDGSDTQSLEILPAMARVQSPTFGELLRSYRVAAGLTQEALAEQAGLGSRTISDLERGVASRPQRHTLLLLADALELTDAQRHALVGASRAAWAELQVVREPGQTAWETPAVTSAGPVAAPVSARPLTARRPGSGWIILLTMCAAGIVALPSYLFLTRSSATPTFSLSRRPVAVWVGSAHALQFRSPSGVAVDNKGTVYVADTGHDRIVALSPDGRLLRVLGGAGSRPGQLREPSSVAVDGLGDVYVADTGNARFQIFSPTGTPTEEWTGYHPYDPTNTLYGPPRAIAVSPAGRIYVAAPRYVGEVDRSSGNEVVQYGDSHFIWGTEEAVGIAVDAHANVYLTASNTGKVYKLGEHPSTDTDGPLLAQWGGQPESPAGLEHPLGIAIDQHDHVYIADAARQRIQVYTSSGRWLASWPRQGGHWFDRPSGIAVDTVGNVYVADQGNNQVFKLSPSGHLLARWGETSGLPGVTEPSKLTVDARGDVYAIVKGGNSIASISPDGRLRALWRASAWTGPGATSLTDIAISPRGYLYVTDALGGRVLELSRAGASVSTRDGATLPQHFGTPSAVAVDTHGDLYVLDSSTGVILKSLPTGASVSWWGSDGDPGVLSSPQALDVDPNGRTYVIDQGVYQVHTFAPDGTPLARWGEHGTRPGALEAPADVAVDGRGRVYVIDAQLNRLSVFSSHGQLLASLGTTGSRPGEFLRPTGVAVDVSGDVYVADTGNNRIQVFAPH
jgi:tripartite motif-containing protein 71